MPYFLTGLPRGNAAKASVTVREQGPQRDLPLRPVFSYAGKSDHADKSECADKSDYETCVPETNSLHPFATPFGAERIRTHFGESAIQSGGAAVGVRAGA